MPRKPAPEPEPSRRPYGGWSIDHVKARDCWRVRPPKSVDPTRRPHYEKTRADAELWAAQEQARLARGPGVVDDDITLGAYLAWWIDTVSASKRWSAGTIKRYEADTARLGLLLARPLRSITRVQLQARVAELLRSGTRTYKTPPHTRGIEPVSVNATARTWRAALEDARREYELIPENPADRLKLPEVVVEEAETWTREEADTLMAAYRGHRHEVILVLMLGASIRVGEALAVRWSDVDWDRSRLSLHATGAVPVVQEHTKSRRRRWVPLAMPLLLVLRRQAASQFWDAEFICEHRPGRRWSYTTVLRVLKEMCTEAGVRPLATHAARHHAASHLDARGLGVATISKILGHSSTAITAKYLHTEDPQIERAGAMFAELFPAVQNTPLEAENGTTGLPNGATDDLASSSQ